MKKIVFTGGGTLGHVMPNLYLMDELKDFECYYIGGSNIDRDKVQSKVKKYYQITTTKFVRNKFFVNFTIPFKLIKGIREAKRALKEIGPDIVFSKGGYVSLPVVIAARKLRIPIIAHESDYSFGLANKIILKLCNIMCVNFKNLESKNKKIVYTGPIFSKVYDKTVAPSTSGLNLDKDKSTILIVGGSLGSQVINENVFACVKDLIKKCNVIHITGKGKQQYPSFKNYNCIEMANNMVDLYRTSDLVIGRSGAGVTAEAFYLNKPMLLIPLENRATRGDQLLNARYYEDQGVAKIIRESKLNPNALIVSVDELFSNIYTMQEKYKSTQKINGRQKIVELIIEMSDKSSKSS